MSPPTDSPKDPNREAVDAPTAPRVVRLGQVSEAASALRPVPEQVLYRTSPAAGTMVNHLMGELAEGSTIQESQHSTQLPSSRRAGASFPEPQLGARALASRGVPASQPLPRRSMSWLRVIIALVGVMFGVVVIGVIAVRQFPLADAWLALATDRTIEFTSSLARLVPATLGIRSEPAIARLVVQSWRGDPAEPAPLGLALQGRTKGAVVIIRGLAAGMTVSAGEAVGADAWQIAETDLGNAWVGPPRGFVGSADLVAELHLPGGRVADRQAIRFEWMPLAASRSNREEITTPPVSPAIAERQADRGEGMVPLVSPPPAQRQFDRGEAPRPPVSPVPTERQLSREEIEVLVKRGKDFVANGDLAAARVALQRAAEASDAEAALALAATYDPLVLRGLGVYGFAPDVALARSWYERAKQLGSAEAPRRLESLASGAR